MFKSMRKIRIWKNFAIIFIVTQSLLTSCSVFKVQPLTSEDIIVYPQPPDTARIQFITSINNSSDIQGRQSSFSRFIFGEDTPLGIERPGSIHVAGDKVFICDASIAGLIVIDLTEQSFEKFIPGGRGALQAPLSCYADTLSGKLFVTDGQRKQTVIYDLNNNLKYINAFSGSEPYMPTGIAVNNDRIWLVDRINNKIHVYDKNSFREVLTFPDVEKGDDGFLYSPSSIEVAGNYVYIADFGDFNIKVYDLEGNFIRTVGSYGNNFGQFFRINGIAVDHNDKLFAIDAAYENIQIFNDKGQVLMFFGGRNGNAGDMILPRHIAIDYKNVDYFKDYIDPEYNIAYLIWVTCGYGSNKLQVYGMIEY